VPLGNIQPLLTVRASGKVKKVALIACMRKLLTILNAMIKNQQQWRPSVVKNM
jgi:transposase